VRLWTNYGHIELVRETLLDWQAYAANFSGRPVLIMGAERYAQMQFALETKDNILESDPGPLDARVP
jgi:hypothetical protein